MKIEHPLTGAMVALITPMFADGTIDFENPTKTKF
jgi:dihydrodipicolinate synthase/N-acetylneuraminate lyase